LRWPKNYQPLDEQGQLRKPGEISKAKRSWEHRCLWDARRRCQRQTGIIAFPVPDPTHDQPLWVVVVRRKGQPPWYLLSNHHAYSPELAWQIALAYAFLLSLLHPTLASQRSWLLRTFCHRTGKRSRVTPAPLYRLRIALCFLWLTHPPTSFSFL